MPMMFEIVKSFTDWMFVSSKLMVFVDSLKDNGIVALMIPGY
jgi:hypothetical protein